MVGLDIVLYVFAGNSTSKDKFVDTKISKAKQFELNSHTKMDIVFVGSSRTLNHISTNIFKENNISVYNFGVSGNFIGDYPFVTNTIKKIGAKQVVFSIRVADLFTDYKENGFKIYTTDELIANFQMGKIAFFKTFSNYFANFHLFLRYSEAIYNRLVGFYANFNPDSTNDEKQIFSNDAFKIYDKKVSSVFDLRAKSDCRLIETKVVNSNFTKNKKIIIAKCSNGDYMLFANAISRENFGKEMDLGEINLNTVKYFQNYVIDPLANNDIKVVVILEPVFDGTNIKYNINEITSAIKNAKVIDLTSMKFDDAELSDWDHINYLGRKRYSEFLVKLYLAGGL